MAPGALTCLRDLARHLQAGLTIGWNCGHAACTPDLIQCVGNIWFCGRLHEASRNHIQQLTVQDSWNRLNLIIYWPMWRESNTRACSFGDVAALAVLTSKKGCDAEADALVWDTGLAGVDDDCGFSHDELLLVWEFWSLLEILK
jgi:hypothetical protein